LNEEMNTMKYTIRPAGRHILTIGSDLIKDKYAAIVELVKNAYDADSPLVHIKFSTFLREGEKCIKIEICDRGHGMSREDVINKWMVPSTKDKLERKFSPKKRKLQGKKGIGRYAASILGEDLLLETIDEEKILTTLFLIWDNFNEAEYLEDVEVLIESNRADQPGGTKLTITGKEEKYLEDWSKRNIDKLRFELKKLVPPFQNSEIEGKRDDLKIESNRSIKEDDFKITLEFENFPSWGVENFQEEIAPFPLIDLYDYRISGKVSPDGKADLIYHNNKIRNSTPEDINIKIPLNVEGKEKQEYCGEILLDFRLFDRDRDSIEALIARGLKDPESNEFVGIREARDLLNDYNGVAVYRNGFRIRPLGDPGYDWLELDKSRVQNPTQKIGSDQVIGYILIQPEDSSNLEEKSARDGLKENKYYFGLREISKKVLLELEGRRYIFKRKQGLARKPEKINTKIQQLFEYDDLKGEITKILESFKVGVDNQGKILKLIDEKANQNNRIVEEIKEIVAIYQKHATVGKIINVILHEGRHPLNYFVNQTPNFQKWREELLNNYSPELLEKIISRLNSFNENSDKFIKLFNKLDPLAARKRAVKKNFELVHAINESISIFETELVAQGIEAKIDCQNGIKLYGWEEDFITAFVNLIENSLYWLGTVERNPKKISFRVLEDETELLIEYRDNGPGIEMHFIEDEVIFDPGFSTKPDGTGLGLAIAGEAMDRNSGKLKAIYSTDGVYFRIEIKGDVNE